MAFADETKGTQEIKHNSWLIWKKTWSTDQKKKKKKNDGYPLLLFVGTGEIKCNYIHGR